MRFILAAIRRRRGKKQAMAQVRWGLDYIAFRYGDHQFAVRTPERAFNRYGSPVPGAYGIPQAPRRRS